MTDKRPSARIPRGFSDRSKRTADDACSVASTALQIFDAGGFDYMETPAVEYSDALGKFLPDQDRPNEGVYSFRDENGEWLSLRYDLTAPLSRYIAQNYKELQFPCRLSRSGYVFRNEKPGPDRYREFWQADADIVGTDTAYADAETCLMLYQIMQSLGFAEDQYRIRVGDRRILDGILSKFSPDSSPESRLKAFRAFDKIDSIGVGGVKELLGKSGRMDKSGDFTEGLGLPESAIEEMFHSFGNIRGIGKDYIEDMDDMLEKQTRILNTANNATDGRIPLVFDPMLVRGIGYYTDFVMECSLTVDVPNDKGTPIRFGAIAGGGRYNGLIERFTGKKVPSVGLSVGVSRIAYAMRQLGMFPEPSKWQNKVLITVMEGENVSNYYELANDLRNRGVRTEVYQGASKKLGKQLDYANKRNIPICLIRGEVERGKDTVVIRDMMKGNQYDVSSFTLPASIKDMMDDQKNIAYPVLETRVR